VKSSSHSARSAGARRLELLKLIYRRVDEIKPDAANPRRHSKKQIRQIAASIEAFGFIVPILIDRDGNIVAGHGRWLACRYLGFTEVPTLCVDHLTPAQACAFRIADNRLTEIGTWDDRLLAQQLKDLSLLGLDFSGQGSHRNNVQLGRFGRNRTNVWCYPGVNSFARTGAEGNLLALHPTVKPVAMVADAILDCSARGDIVLDSFLGSGTTVIAAERTGRRCYGLELDPLHVDTGLHRWQALTGGTARHAVSGRSFDDLAAEVGAADAV